MLFFNNAGPSVAGQHYMIDPLARIDVGSIETLIAQQRYFILHAPRQTGKTTCLLALMHHLNHQGQYRALYVNIEGAQGVRGNADKGMIQDALNEHQSNFTKMYDSRLAY